MRCLLIFICFALTIFRRPFFYFSTKLPYGKIDFPPEGFGRCGGKDEVEEPKYSVKYTAQAKKSFASSNHVARRRNGSAKRNCSEKSIVVISLKSISALVCTPGRRSKLMETTINISAEKLSTGRGEATVVEEGKQFARKT